MLSYLIRLPAFCDINVFIRIHKIIRKKSNKISLEFHISKRQLQRTYRNTECWYTWVPRNLERSGLSDSHYDVTGNKLKCYI